MYEVILVWKDSLRRLLSFYETKRGRFITFFPKLFLFFVLLNIFCYWWAIFTAFPEYVFEGAGAYYFKVQFLVGIFGAVFDSFSFFVTVFIIRRALRASGNLEYAAHLSFDLLIAVLATFWVLFVFSFSGWIIHFLESTNVDLVQRNEDYEDMLRDAIASPADNLRNIYFGLIMGISAGLPTFMHVCMFFRSCVRMVLSDKNKNGSA